MVVFAKEVDGLWFFFLCFWSAGSQDQLSCWRLRVLSMCCVCSEVGKRGMALENWPVRKNNILNLWEVKRSTKQVRACPLNLGKPCCITMTFYTRKRCGVKYTSMYVWQDSAWRDVPYLLHSSEGRQEHRLQLWIPVVLSALWSSSITFMLSFSLPRTWGELGFRVESTSAFCFRLFSVSCHSYPSAIAQSEFCICPFESTRA